MKLCSFDSLANLAVNKNGDFFRKRVVGDSATYLTGEMINRLNAITEKHFRGYDINCMFDGSPNS